MARLLCVVTATDAIAEFRRGPVLNHDESPSQVAERIHPGVYIRSFYFYDPDGIMLEFACWTKEFNADEANASPRTAADRHRRPIGGTH